MTAAPVLITGATGFIGRGLCLFLLSQQPEREIIALVRSQSDLPERITQIVVPDWSLSGLTAALDGRPCKTIFHLAAYGVDPAQRDASAMLAANTVLPATMVGLAHLCDAALVSAGSNSEYAVRRDSETLTEDSPLQADALYGATKAAGWLAASAHAVAQGVSYMHLRLFNTYGPGEAGHRLLPSLAAALTAGRRVPMSDGAQVRDFIHIDDVCRAFLAAERTAATPGNPQVFNICTGQGQSVKTFAKAVCDIIGADPQLLGFGDLPRRPDEPPSLVGSPARAEAVLGFRAQTDLKAGLALSLGYGLEAA